MRKPNHSPSRHVQEVVDKLYALDARAEMDGELRHMFDLISQVLVRQDAQIRALRSDIDRRRR